MKLQEYIKKQREEKTKYHREWRQINRLKIRKYNKEYNKVWRKKKGYHNEVNSKKRYPEKQKARMLTRNALISGKIIKLPCEVCGNKRVQAHHDDYSKPLKVKWFCALHHTEYHKKFDSK